MPPPAIGIFAHQLALELHDPCRPAFCVVCVEQFVLAHFTLDGDTFRATGEFLVHNHHGVFTGIMEYLTAARSDDELPLLRSSLKAAVRRCRRRPRHAPTVEESTILESAIRSVALFFIPCVTLRARLVTAQRFSRQGWPQGIHEILPRGPRDCLTSFIFWISREHSPTLILAFIAIFRICRPEIMPELLEDGQRGLFIDVMCRLLDPPDATSPSSPLRNIVTLSVQSAASLLDAISAGPGAQASSWPSLIRGAERKVLRSLEAAHAAFANDLSAKGGADIVRLITLTYIHLKMPIPSYVRATFCDEAPRGNDLYERLFKLIRESWNRVACYSPDCNKHASELDTGKLRICSGCNLFRYCSRECQKMHWTRKSVPHKSACAALRRVLDLAPGSLTKEIFVAACRDSLWADTNFEELVTYLVSNLAANLLPDEVIETYGQDVCYLILSRDEHRWLGP